MRVTVLYFAAVRAIVDVDEERLHLPPSVTTVRLFADHLARQRPALAEALGAVRFARNEEFAGLDDALADGDVLAIIPPVAGG